MAFQATYEIADFGQGDSLIGIQPLGLHINDVQAKLIFLDNSVHSAVADPAKRPTHLDSSAAVAHAHQKVDDKALEESWTERMHSPNDIARQFGIEELETRSDRVLRVVPRTGFLGGLAGLALRSPGDEFRITFQESKVDLAHPLGKELPASVGGATIAASGQFDQPRL